MEKINPLLSIITVSLNHRPGLERTKDSIFGQSSKEFEWIVVDGDSSDGTAELFRTNDDDRVQFISEPDDGIYDAMNKGLIRARGVYVCFLNAGDCFYDSTVIDQVAGNAAGSDIYFGEVEMHSASGGILGLRSEVLPHHCPSVLKKEDFRFGMLVSHQAFFVRRRLAPSYNLAYRFSSDMDWMLRILEAQPSSVRLGTLATVIREGATTQNWGASQWERFKILAKHFGIIDALWCHAGIVLRRLRHLFRF